MQTLEIMAKILGLPKVNHLIFILNISLGNNCGKVASFALLNNLRTQVIQLILLARLDNQREICYILPMLYKD